MIWFVYKKEILELLRDRKTLIFVIIFPTLILPLIMTIMAMLTAKQHIEEQHKVLTYGVVGEANFSDLVEKLAVTENMKRKDITADSSYEKLIKSGEFDFIILIPKQVKQGQDNIVQSSIKLYFNDSLTASKIYFRVNTLVNPLVVERREQWLNKVGIGGKQMEAVLQPIILEKENVADQRESIGEKLGGFIPYLLILICFSGASYPAMDIGVGEKERGTLETLLLTPTSRASLVIGKMCVLFTTSMLSVFLALFSVLVWGAIVISLLGVDLNIEFIHQFQAFEFILIFTLLIPVAVMLSCILFSMSIYAKSAKEAQNYITPLSIVIISLVMILLLPGIELKGIWVLIPITNVALAMKELFKGTMDYTLLIYLFTSTVILAAALTWCTTRWFSKESVLFRS